MNKKETDNLLLPRWAVPLVWAVIILVIQFLLPRGIARFAPRWGWSQQTPSPWNFAGLIAVVVGLGIYSWCLAFHFQTYHSDVRLSFSPPQLVIGGPYRFSRNPMYLSGLFVWLGWTIYWGSPAVLIGLILLFSIFNFHVIPGEEKQLEGLFGDDYLTYRQTIRRWLGRYQSLNGNSQS